MLIDLLPLLAPAVLLLGAGLRAQPGRGRPWLAEGAALAALAVALAQATRLVLHGPWDSPLIGLVGIGISARIDAVSAAMSVLVCFIGWVVVRYATTYLQGEARRANFLSGLCLTLACVLLLVLTGNLLQLVLAWVGTSLAMHRLLL